MDILTQYTLLPTVDGKNCYRNTTFVPGFGYVLWAAETAALQSLTFQLYAQPTLKWILFGKETCGRLRERSANENISEIFRHTSEKNIEEELVAEERKNEDDDPAWEFDMLEEEEEEEEDEEEEEEEEEEGEKLKYQAISHGFLNIKPEDEIAYDHFLLSAAFSIRPTVYRHILDTKDPVHRLPFQQLMALDTIVSMAEKTPRIMPYLDTLMMQLRHDLGAPWLTPHQIKTFNAMLNDHNMKAYNVRRRMGKTTGAMAELVKSILCFPEAKIAALYLGPSSQIASTCKSWAKAAFQRLIPCFNDTQQRMYEKRRRMREKTIAVLETANCDTHVFRKLNREDYYYKCRYFSHATTRTMKVEEDGVVRGTVPGQVCGQEIGVAFVRCNGDPSWEYLYATNRLWCKGYEKSKCRGSSRNLIMVDESCFMRVEAYNEVWPMAQVGKGRMIIMSSHRSESEATSKKDAFVSIPRLRGRDVLVSNITYVCPDHVRSMILEKTASTCCICNIFSQPYHLTANSSHVRITDLFAKSIVGGSGKATARKEQEARNRASAQAELGLCEEVAEATDEKLAVIESRLATEKATRLVRSDMVNVRSAMDHGTFCRTVCVYIDTAYVSASDRSHHAMAFVGLAENDKAAGSVTYVLLAVEEFRFDEVIDDIVDFNTDLKVARVCSQTIMRLSQLYNGYLEEWILFLEANSTDMRLCWRYINEAIEAKRPSSPCLTKVRLYTSVITYGPRDKTTTGVDCSGQLTSVTPASRNPAMEHGQQFDDDDDSKTFFATLRRHQKPRENRFHPYPSHENPKPPSTGTNQKYRVGYRLLGNKLIDTRHFFNIYNGVVPLENFRLASELFTYTLLDHDLYEHATQKIECVRVIITPSGKVGCTGKRANVQDDVAVCISLATILMKRYRCTGGNMGIPLMMWSEDPQR